MLKKYKISTVGILLLFTIGCGGIQQEQVKEEVISSTISYDNRIPIKILKVNNLTNNPDYDVMCNYIHIKTAQILSDTGRYNVVSSDLLDDFSENINTTKQEKAKQAIKVNITDIDEVDGGTLNLIFYSSHTKIAKVTIKTIIYDENQKKISSVKEQGISKNGIWGVIAKVNRKNILKKKGVLELDNSSLGLATIKALKKIMKKISN